MTLTRLLVGTSHRRHYQSLCTSISSFQRTTVPRPNRQVGLLKESGNAALDEIAEMGRERDIQVETSIRLGRPSRELLDYVDENDADLITLGAHGQTSEVHLRSTTERVIRTSKQPTLSVR